MAQELNKIGIWVHRRVAVGCMGRYLEIPGRWKQGKPGDPDHWRIRAYSRWYYQTTSLPVFWRETHCDDEALNNVKNIFQNILKRPLLERNLKQAEVPDVCTVIPNKRGTAPGMWFEKNEKIFISMPGVPHEMKGMMTLSVLPKLKERFALPPIIHRTLLTAGIGESFLAETD